MSQPRVAKIDVDATMRGHGPERRSERGLGRWFEPCSLLLVTALLLAAGGGLLEGGPYRDNRLVTAGWYGNDLVTLAVVLPLLVVATLAVRRGSARAVLTWAGVAAYALYTYLFFAFGAAFNGAFLLYVAVVVVASWGFVGVLTSSAMQRIAGDVEVGRWARGMGGLVVAVAAGLGLFWIATSLVSSWRGEVPAMVAAVEHPTNVTAALDLWLVVSSGIAGGVMLIRRHGWGFVIATIWSVKGLLYMPALSAAALAQFSMGATDDLMQLALWVPIGAVCAVTSWFLLRAAPGDHGRRSLESSSPRVAPEPPRPAFASER